MSSNILRFVHETVPLQDGLVLWIKRARGANSPRGWKMLAVRSDRIDVVADRPDELPPGAAVWDGQQILLAPWEAPRWGDHPETLREPFVSYMKQLDGAGR